MNLPTLTRGQRVAVLLVLYVVVLVISTWLAYGLRFDFAVPLEHQIRIGDLWVKIWGIKLLALALAGQFSSLLSFFSLPDLRRLGLAVGIVTIGLFGSWYLLDALHGMSRGVILLDGILTFLGMALCRLGFRLARQNSSNESEKQTVKSVGIVGAGEVGAALARELQSTTNVKPVMFFDDSERKKGTQVHGIPVIGAVEILQAPDAPELDEIIIAMPSAPGVRVREVVELLDGLELHCRTVPAISQIALGEIVTRLRPVEIGDILGRESVNLELEKLKDFYSGRIIVVTGSGGSIGSELCRQLARMDLQKLILVERSEYQLFKIESELKDKAEVIPELVDVQDETAMSSMLARHGPSIIFHAAAFKHVTLVERQPLVAIRNNVLATHQLARLASKNGVAHFFLISTDKAVEPSSVMGATKLLAERVMEGHALSNSGTRFIVVRFGNVLGSSGSVVPIFQQQIEHGGPVTVRDKNVTRFFMSIPEAAGLVLHSAVIGGNGDRFILDMGEPVRIFELAKEMIRLAGRVPDKDIEIQFTGLLPGEKLHEKLYSDNERLVDTAHAKIKRIEGAALTAEAWRPLEIALQNVEDLGVAAVNESQLRLPGGLRGAQGPNIEAARDWLLNVLPEYKPE